MVVSSRQILRQSCRGWDGSASLDVLERRAATGSRGGSIGVIDSMMTMVVMVMMAVVVSRCRKTRGNRDVLMVVVLMSLRALCSTNRRQSSRALLVTLGVIFF